MEGDHLIIFKFADIPGYECHVKLDSNASTFAKITTLYFIVDYIKKKAGVDELENKEVQICFDQENITTYEEILQTRMESVLIKQKGPSNPFVDHLNFSLEETEMIYLNNKE